LQSFRVHICGKTLPNSPLQENSLRLAVQKNTDSISRLREMARRAKLKGRCRHLKYQPSSFLNSRENHHGIRPIEPEEAEEPKECMVITWFHEYHNGF
jgi:hypothetical protein